MPETVATPDVIPVNDSAAVRQAALKLHPRDRAALAHDLWDSLEGVAESEFEPTEPPQLSEEWMQEIQRRIESYRSGKSIPLDGPTVMAELRRRAGL